MKNYHCPNILSAVLALLLLLVSAIGAGAEMGALRLFPGDAAIAPAAGDQTAPAIAQGGNLMLAVWSDNRANVTGGLEGETSKDIYGVRFDAEGNLLDAVPIAITAARSTQDNPKVVWNGTHWLVVFESYELGGTGYYYQKSLAAVRVAPSGQVLDANPIFLNGLIPLGSTYWAAASDGANWVVVNQGTSTGGAIVAMRISADGVVLDPPTHSLVKATYYNRSNLKLAYSGGVFLLTFNDAYVNARYDTKAVRFDSSLTLLDATPLALLSSPLSDLAGNGSAFYIIWNRQNADYSVNVAGSRVSTAGLKLDGNGVNLSGTKTPYAYAPAAVVWDGLNWRVTWGEAATAYTARVTAAGQVLDPGSVTLPGLVAGPSAGNGAGGAQLVWTVFANNTYDVLSGNITASNTAGAGRIISLGAPRQIRTDIATSGNGYMVVYYSSTSSENRVMAQPLDAAGNPLTAEPIQLDAGNYSTGPGSPNVAWNGSLYLVAWGNANGIVAQRLLADGTKVDPAPFVVMTPGFGPADVAAIGDTFLVTGRRFGQTPETIGAIGARVRGSDGAVLDATTLLLGGYYVSRSPAVTPLGGRFLVAFISNASHDNSAAATTGVFVPTTGASVVIPGNFFNFSTNSGNGIFDLGLASSGDTALLVQPVLGALAAGGTGNDLVARLVQADGTAGPVMNLTPWSGNQYKPRVAWDDTNFVVAYQDQKNGLAEQGLEQLDARSDLFAMRVTPTGAIVDPQGFVFSALPTGETDPAVASLDGVTLLAGSIMLNDATFANYRIGYKQLDATANEWPIAVAAATPAGGDVPLTVSFSSAGSGDLDGTVATYAWDFGDGTTSTQADPLHTYTAPGPFVATLAVTDNGGAQTTQTVLVKAVAPNQLPIAVASAAPVSGPAPLNVIFYADGSYDPDGFLGNIQWTFSDGGSYWGATAYHTFYSAGTYTAILTVYDSRGATGTTTLTINVGGANQPPVAAISATPTSGTAPLVVAFSSAGSSDADGNIASYSWNFGDGITSTAPNPITVYASAGTYIATLTVTDNAGATASASTTITVMPSTTPTLRSTAINLSATRIGSRVTVSGQVVVRNAANAAVSGVSVNVTWRKPDGTTVTQTATTNSSGIATFRTSGGRGTYTLTVNNLTKTGYTFDKVNSVLSKSITK